ncbi:hypothetical protein QBC47DRAFT_395239 [Echria macrotheca]|uniref:Uncharacterized protein n=1 Tax=Echria macrotheca TaxID=438768 RepID=A0AAJ0B5V2_9PEZI|nr:hypothetical protein QBC47DRAFT_395239 [Echria macrotheca]
MLDPPENPSSLVNVFCPTGDCTFDETTSYSSLGVCPRVFDISDRMKGSLSMNKTSGDMSWNYTLPSGMEFSYDPSRPDRPVLTPLMATAGTMYNAAIELMMLAVDCVGGYDPNVPASQRGCSWKPRAFNISLYPCVYTYGNIRYERGVLVERTISTTPLGPTNGAYGLVGNYPSTPGTDCSGSPGSPQGSKTQRILTLDMVKGKRNTTYYDPDCVYEMAESRMDGLMLGLTRIFSWPEAPDKHLQRKFLSVWLVDGKGPDGMYMRLQTSEMYPELVGDEWLRTLWRNGTASLASVRNFMDGLAGTLTATIRQTGTSANSKPLLGVMYESRTCVSVNWSWLLYPAILLAFTSVFFILVMYRSHRYTRPGGKQSGRSAWKSSVLPLLWHGIQDSTRDAAPGSLDRFAVMEKYSDEVLVRIERRGWEMPLKGGPGDEQGLWFLRESNLPDY